MLMPTIVALFRRRYLLVCALLFASPVLATAASFDCNIAKTALEKTICADSKLSAEDTEMTQRYNRARSLLSDQGKNILRSGQQQWLKLIKILCLDYKRTEGATACLRRQYEERMDNLETAAVQIGPYLFSRVDGYTSPGVNGQTGKPLEQHIGLPRIDQPLSVDAERWNALIVRLSGAMQANWCYGQFQTADAKDSDTLSEQMLNFKVFAQGAFINVKFTHFEQCGAGAPDVEVSNLSYFMGPPLRPLTAADLFLQGKPWTSLLAAQAWREFNLADLDSGAQKDLRDGVNKVISDPAAWSFTEQGLVITFAPGYGGASLASGPVDLTIPWKNLYPFVTSTAPIPGH